jgi:hypothetical protein
VAGRDDRDRIGAPLAVTLTILRMTTTIEHPAPDVAAALAEDGVASPDEHFSRMVEELRSEPERGAREVLSPGFNERTVDAQDNPAEAAAEQSSAMTPTAQPSRPDDMHLRGRRPVIVIVLCTVVAVAGFCAAVAFAFQH